MMETYTLPLSFKLASAAALPTPTPEQMAEVEMASMIHHRLRHFCSATGGRAYSLALCLPAGQRALEILHTVLFSAPDDYYRMFLRRHLQCEGVWPYNMQHADRESFIEMQWMNLPLPELPAVYVSSTQEQFDAVKVKGPDRNCGDFALFVCHGFIPTTPLPHLYWSLVGGTLALSKELDARLAVLTADQAHLAERKKVLKKELDEIEDNMRMLNSHANAYQCTRSHWTDPY